MPAAQRDGDANSAGGVVSSSSSVKVNGKDIRSRDVQLLFAEG